MDGATIEPGEEPLGTADRGIERHVLAGRVAVEGDVQVVDPGARHGDCLMIGWTAEHMEPTDGDGRTNRSRYRWNRVRWFLSSRRVAIFTVRRRCRRWP